MSEILSPERFRECVEDLAFDRWGDSELFAHDAAMRRDLSSLVSAMEEIRDTVNDPREIAIRALATVGKGGPSEVAALREALRSLARIETDEEGLPVLVISCGWHCQTSDQTELPLVWAALSRPALTGNGGKP